MSHSVKSNGRDGTLLHRRSVVALLAGGLGLLWSEHRAIAQNDDSETVKFRWRIPVALTDKATDPLPDTVSVEEQEGRGALAIISGAIALVYLAQSILRLRDDIDGGTVIDTRSDELVIERDAALPGGTILVLSDGGPEIFEREEIASPADLIKVLRPGS